jgi:hypothetical protein
MPTLFNMATFNMAARSAAALFMLAMAGLIAAPASADDMAAKLTGTWKGDFINTSGDRYPVTFTISAANGKLTGKGDIPDSSIDTSPGITGTYSGDKSRWETSSGFYYDLTLSESSGTLYLKGGVSGANDGDLKISRSSGQSSAPKGDPYEQAYEFMKQVTAERCECFMNKYAPADGNKAYALSKDGAYGARWSEHISIDEARDAALASCRKKPSYKPENPCVVFMENDRMVFKR